jgi:hypothetical protein
VKINQAIDVEFLIGLDESNNYAYKFQIYNYFIHPGYLKNYNSSGIYNIAVALIDLENAEPSIEGVSFNYNSENDIELKSTNQIPEFLLPYIGSISIDSLTNSKDRKHIVGYSAYPKLHKIQLTSNCREGSRVTW